MRFRICGYCLVSHKATPEYRKKYGIIIYFCPFLLSVKTPKFIEMLSKNIPKMPVYGPNTLRMVKYKDNPL